MKMRQKLLLDEILQDGAIPLARLAEDFAVTTKTVRNDVDEINFSLREQMGEDCLRVENGLVLFCGSDELRADYPVTLDDYYLYKLSAEERMIMILVELATTDGLVTIGALAEKLYVSRGTINSDLLLVRDWCRRSGARLSSRKGKGIRLEESGARRRELLAAVIREYRAVSGIRGLAGDSVQLYRSLFKGINMSQLRDVLLQAEERFSFVLSDEAYEELVVHLALWVRQGKHQSVAGGPGRFPVERPEYRMAEYIVALVAERFELTLSPAMADYIASHIRGESSLLPDAGEDASLPYIQLAAEQLIHAVGKDLNFDFQMDPRLYDGLIKHLCAAIARVRSGITAQNPLRDTLIKENQALYRALRRSTQGLETTAQASFNDDELSYLLIYFATAMEREEQQRSKERKPPSVAVLCATGKGTAQLVQENLRKHFRLDMRFVVAVHQLEQLQREERLDFIISTVPIRTSLPCVYVSPVVRREDIERLDRMILSLGFPGSFCSASRWTGEMVSHLAARAAGLAEALGGPDQEEELARALDALLREEKRKTGHSTAERKSSPMLSQLLKTQYIALDVPAGDWQEAVRAGGELLLRHGVVERAYIEASIANVKDLGPYIVLTKGVAIPHAGREFGVHQTAISLARLREAVCFGNEENDPVRFVFTLATVDSSSHLLALRDLVSLFDQPAFFELLARAARPEEISDFILSYEATKGEKEA